MIRISLILAIVAALAAAALNFTMVRQKVVTLQQDRDNEKSLHQKFETDYNTTKRNLDKTSAQLTQTNMALVGAISDRDRAVADADAAGKRANDLNDKLAKTTKDLSDTKDELALFQQSGYTPAQVLAFAKQIKDLEDNLAGSHDENKLLGTKIAKLVHKLSIYEDPNRPIPLPAKLSGKILVCDPKWDFVVLNIGDNQCPALEGGELLVSRNGKLVGKVVVRSVQKDRSIANVVPGWKLGEMMEGDQVIPAHPES